MTESLTRPDSAFVHRNILYLKEEETQSARSRVASGALRRRRLALTARERFLYIARSRGSGPPHSNSREGHSP